MQPVLNEVRVLHPPTASAAATGAAALEEDEAAVVALAEDGASTEVGFELEHADSHKIATTESATHVFTADLLFPARADSPTRLSVRASLQSVCRWTFRQP